MNSSRHSLLVEINRLANIFKELGPDRSKRDNAALSMFSDLTPAARLEVRNDVRMLALELFDLLPLLSVADGNAQPGPDLRMAQ